MPTYPQTATYRDAKGNTSVVKFFVTAADAATASTDAQAVLTAMDALTNCHRDSSKGAFTSQPGNSVTPARIATEKYETVEDKALLSYEIAAGSIHRYMIPGPKIALFLNDDQTVDSTNAALGTLNTAVLVAVSAASGELMVQYDGGIRIRRKLKRKVNIKVLSANLAAPAE